ncbi:YihY/virulence factor BrkB family protein [Staphylococcus ratti]|uniref:YihY/virulence factor BrkB family protein n=1 Tax=Staphylococcus ratti TaxID=2892440 RepID=A0ABY3PEQ9_9STAP|nr:YihY/virulence factor BrkB family protein [Staphylococcus ratti]UEX90810.1 YihY/virulence factor BrkB family protein [Staphylococcus ratti]
MANKHHKSSGFVEEAKDKFQKKASHEKENSPNPNRQGDAKGDVHEDHNFVKPQPFQSKEAKKDNQTFFVSRINKPAKYTDRPNFFSYLIYRIGKDDASGLAAQLAYYFMLSLFPMLIFILSLIPLFKIDQQSIISQIESNAPDQASSIITNILTDVMSNANGGILSFGLILALWTASNGMTALMNSFNVAYDVEDSRNFLVSKAMAVFFTLLIGITMPITLVLFTFGQQIGNILFGPLGLDEAVRWVFGLLRTVLPVLAIFIVFTLLYTMAPNVKIKLKSVLPGALFATVAWILGTLAFGYYVSNFGNYSKTYGSIGGVIVLMLWLYITGFILIIGAEVNAIFHHRKVAKGKTPEEITYDEMDERGEEDLAEAYNNMGDETHPSQENENRSKSQKHTQYEAPDAVERTNDGHSNHIKTKDN